MVTVGRTASRPSPTLADVLAGIGKPPSGKRVPVSVAAAAVSKRMTWPKKWPLRREPAPGETPVELELLLAVTIAGRTVGKGRPRVAGVKAKADGSQRKVRTYTPKKTVDAEDAIRNRLSTAMRGRPPIEDREFKLVLVVREAPADKEHGRFDFDNYLKLVSDAANRLVWHDDIQVASSEVEIYRNVDEPSLTIEIYAYRGFGG
jgi:Holliday junction resolvase RusA-like endonuclease